MSPLEAYAEQLEADDLRRARWVVFAKVVVAMQAALILSVPVVAIWLESRIPADVFSARPAASVRNAMLAWQSPLLRLDRDTARRGCIACMTRDCTGSSCWLNAEAACVAGNTGGFE